MSRRTRFEKEGMGKANGRGEAGGTWRPLSRWAAATALCALALSTLITECYAACSLVASVVPIQEFDNPSEVSITGTVPSPGACSYWQIQVNNLSSCSQPNSTMLFELWLEDQQSSPIYPGMNIQGLYLMATRKSMVSDTTDIGPPSVVLDARGNPIFRPSQKADGDSKTYTDDGAQANHATTQRFAVPVGRFSENSTWLLSLQNTAAQPLIGMQFSVRVTCLAAPNQVPCPRPDSNGLPCNSNSTGTCVLDPLSPGREVCVCSSGTIGSSCNIPITDMSHTGSTWLPTYVPGQSWTYFNVSVAAAGRSRLVALLLVELQKQAASMDWSQPVLQLRAQSNTSSLNLPSYAAIDPLKFNINEDCACTNCSCFHEAAIPYQAEYLSYEYTLASNDSSATVFAWVIGIFNNAPYSPGVDSGALMIRARYTVSDNNQVPLPLCPMDCSGQGNCLKVPGYGAMYNCDCNAGYGGPYCQGQLRMIPQLSTSNGFRSDSVSMQPGEMDVYLVLIDLQNSIAAGNSVLLLSWSLLPASLQAFLVLNPRLSISLGQRYFEPELAHVLNATSSVPALFPITLDQSPNSYFPWWYIGVYNSNRSVVAPGSYTLSLSLPGGSDQATFDSLINKLQLGIIGAVAALIILLLSFMTIRVLILRRHVARSSLMMDMSLSGMNIVQQTQQQAQRGVPPAVAESFLTFTYSKEDFVQHCQNPAPAGDTRPASPAGQRQQQLAPPAAAARVAPLRPVTAAGVREEACENGHDVPQCSVCICNYEEGDVLRQLPCNHIFHKGCIDPWLTTHVTCPNCRTPLTPSMQLSPLYQERAATA